MYTNNKFILEMEMKKDLESCNGVQTPYKQSESEAVGYIRGRQHENSRFKGISSWSDLSNKALYRSYNKNDHIQSDMADISDQNTIQWAIMKFSFNYQNISC